MIAWSRVCRKCGAGIGRTALDQLLLVLIGDAAPGERFVSSVQYTCKDTSPLSNYVMHPFWDQAVKVRKVLRIVYFEGRT